MELTVTKSKWFVPLFSVALGAVFFAAQLGRRRSRVGALLARGHDRVRRALPARRTEQDHSRVRGDGRDERFREIDIHATAIAVSR